MNCPHIKSSGETQYCELAESSVRRLESKILKLESDKVKLQESLSYHHNELQRLREENHSLKIAIRSQDGD